MKTQRITMLFTESSKKTGTEVALALLPMSRFHMGHNNHKNIAA